MISNLAEILHKIHKLKKNGTSFTINTTGIKEENMKNIRINISGTSGQGVISSGDIFSYASARKGYYVTTYRAFPSEIRGDGKCNYSLRISEEKAHTVSSAIDIKVALDADTAFKSTANIVENGVIIYDSNIIPQIPDDIRKDIILYGIPLTDIAKKSASERSKNMVALGIVCEIIHKLNLHDQIIKDIQTRYKTKAKDVIESNINAFNAGCEYAKTELKRNDRYEEAQLETSGSKLIMSGNEAIGLAAIAAGCRFFSGYPITPATEIMEWLAKELPKFGGKMLQCEDEIAAIQYAIGASYGGVKSMTATSGPGFSLMQEAIGLASMAEIPLVVADVQRGGPSTGIPTKFEQSDFNAAIFGTHGDCPKIVLAPMNVEDCFYQTINAFNFAEQYQVPVILLSDALLGPRRECVNMIDFDSLIIKNREKYIPDGTEYLRYKDTENGISPISTPGEEGGAYVATGLEHREDCSPTPDSPNHKKMLEKRFRKLETATTRFSKAKSFGDKDAKVGIISWGSTCGAVIEAINLCHEKGLKVEALYPRTLYPFPTSWIEDFARNKEIIIVIEANYTAQFKSTIVERCENFNKNLTITEYLRYDGIPFTADEIAEYTEKVIKADEQKKALMTNRPEHF